MGILIAAQVRVRAQTQPEEGNMRNRTMPVVDVMQNNTAAVFEAEIIDPDTLLPLDVSSGTGVLFYSRTEDRVAVRNGVAGAFFTDGSDGIVQFTLDTVDVGTVRRLICQFEITGYLGAGNLMLEPILLNVIEGAMV